MTELKKKKKPLNRPGGQSSSRLTTRERMLQRKEKFAKGETFGDFIYPKDGTTRVRIKSRGSDEELGLEVIRFYLGKDLGYVISGATFDESCPIMEKYQELKDSKEEDDQALAGQLKPNRRYVLGVIGYKDDKGREIDTDKIDKALVVPRSVYQDIIELYLDEDEWGDMTDNEEGYDIKISRSGSGRLDTTYNVTPCSRKPLPSKLQGEVDLESLVRGQIKSYDEAEAILEKWLNEDHEEDEETEEKPKKAKSSERGLDKNKKKRSNGDI